MGSGSEPILDKQQLDKIRGMVIHGLYAVTLKNGYDMRVFADMKREQNRLFDNFEKNMKLEGKWKEQYGKIDKKRNLKDK